MASDIMRVYLYICVCVLVCVCECVCECVTFHILVGYKV